MLRLEIPERIFKQMLKHAEGESPIEACGILAGRNSMVERFYPMTNKDKSRAHFLMEPKEQFAVIKEIRSAGLEMLAIYHSHPATPARPSAEDIKLALTPDVIYVIVSLQKNESAVKGFIIEKNNITEVSVNIVNNKLVEKLS